VLLERLEITLLFALTCGVVLMIMRGLRSPLHTGPAFDAWAALARAWRAFPTSPR
jgi:hypothetical protein